MYLETANENLRRAKECLERGKTELSYISKSLGWSFNAILSAFGSIPTSYVAASQFINSKPFITEIYRKQANGDYVNAASEHVYDFSLAQQYLSDATALVKYMEGYDW